MVFSGLGTRYRQLLSRGVIGVLLGAGFALRLFHLQEQSFANDEILSMEPLGVPLTAMFGTAALVDHPPLYFLLLRAWVALVGSSEFAVRFLSVFFSVLALALLFALGRRIGGATLGLTGLLLGTSSPFLVYYGQEARMHSLVLFTSLASLWVLLLIEARPSLRRWLLWAVASIVALLSDYIALILLVPEGLYLFFLALFRDHTQRRNWAVAHGMLALLLLPLLLLANPVGGVYLASVGKTTLEAIVGGSFAAFVVGETLRPEWVWAPVGFVLLSAALGLFHRGLRGAHRALLGGTVLLAPLLVALLAARGLGFAPRHVLVATPVFLLLVAAGLLFPARFRRWLTLLWLPVLLLSALSLRNYFFDPWYGREDLRGAARYLDANLRPGDAVVYTAAWAQNPFRYYRRTAFPSAGVPQELPLDPQQVARQLQEVAQSHRRLWLVRWQDWIADPQGEVRRWLEEHTFPTGVKAFPYVTVHTYVTSPPITRERPPISEPMEATLGDKIRFVGYDLDLSQVSSQGRLFLSLYWQPLRPIPESYAVYTHLINQAHRIWGQKDNRPVYDRYPTDRWQPGEYIRDDYQIEILPGTPPGQYHLAVGMYDPATWKPLEVTEQGRSPELGEGRDHLLLGPFTIAGVPPPPRVPSPVQLALAPGLNLVGYDLVALPRPGGTPQELRAGDRLLLTLFWQASRPLATDLGIRFQLRNVQGVAVGEGSAVPVDGLYPTTQWQPGGIVRDQQDLHIPEGAPPGKYQLFVSLEEAEAGKARPSAGPSQTWMRLLDLRVTP